MGEAALLAAYCHSPTSYGYTDAVPGVSIHLCGPSLPVTPNRERKSKSEQDKKEGKKHRIKEAWDNSPSPTRPIHITLKVFFELAPKLNRLKILDAMAS